MQLRVPYKTHKANIVESSDDIRQIIVTIKFGINVAFLMFFLYLRWKTENMVQLKKKKKKKKRKETKMTLGISKTTENRHAL